MTTPFRSLLGNRRAWLCACWLVLGVTPAVGQVQVAGDTPAEETAPPEEKLQGVDLGDFVIREFHVVEDAKSILQFSLFASVRSEDYDEFVKKFEHIEHKVRDNVITAARVTPITEFEDPNLVIFRRHLLLRLRRAVPELPISELLITEFSFNFEDD